MHVCVVIVSLWIAGPPQLTLDAAAAGRTMIQNRCRTARPPPRCKNQRRKNFSDWNNSTRVRSEPWTNTAVRQCAMTNMARKSRRPRTEECRNFPPKCLHTYRLRLHTELCTCNVDARKCTTEIAIVELSRTWFRSQWKYAAYHLRRGWVHLTMSFRESPESMPWRNLRTIMARVWATQSRDEESELRVHCVIDTASLESIHYYYRNGMVHNMCID